MRRQSISLNWEPHTRKRYVMAGLLFPARFIAKKSTDSLVQPVNGSEYYRYRK